MLHEIIALLNDGADSDIWYDPEFETTDEGYEKTSDYIMRVRAAMRSAAMLLEQYEKGKADAS